MIPQIIVLPFAEYDIRESVEYYREQSQKAADDFIDSINNSFIAIKENSKTYPIVKPEIRKYIIRKFPFSIFYIVRIDIISFPI
jgi:plasmid stabilization system protein ParE